MSKIIQTQTVLSPFYFIFKTFSLLYRVANDVASTLLHGINSIILKSQIFDVITNEKARNECNELEFHSYIKLLNIVSGLRFFDNRHYVETTLGRSLKEQILGKQNRHFILVGPPGSGKTAMAWNLCQSLNNNPKHSEMWSFKAVVCLNDLPVTLDGDKCTLLLLNDCFEECAYRTDLYELNNDVMNSLLRRTEKFCTIITISKHILEKLNKSKDSESKWIQQFKQINFTDTLTVHERWNILTEHGMNIVTEKSMINVHGKFILENTLKDLTTDENIGFPLVASLSAKMSDEDFSQRRTAFYKSPLIHVRELVESLAKDPETITKYATLIYTVLKGGQFDPVSIDNKLKTEIDKLLKIKLPYIKMPTKHFLLHKVKAGRVEIIHERMLKLLVKIFGEKYLAFVIKNCDVETLLRFCRTESKYRAHGLLVVPRIDYLKDLIQRLVDEGINYENHVISKDPRVQQFTAEYKQRKNGSSV